MTTNGTGITREEAAIIINLMNPNAVQESSIPVLKKLQKAYPDLLSGTPYLAMIAQYDEKAKISKADATKKIADKIKLVYAIFEECEQIADKAGVNFTFDMNGTYGMGGTYRAGEWVSSSDQC